MVSVKDEQRQKVSAHVITERREPVILGAGMTGLAAGLASGFPIYEAELLPGGICSSYYIKPGTADKKSHPPKDGEAYRFEIGGGHWIWGGDQVVLRLVTSLVPMKTYVRQAAVYLPEDDRMIPYPIQNHLRYLEPEKVVQILQEILSVEYRMGNFRTLKEWLERHFGPTLCKLFFHPFHKLYTAGLWEQIAPQDPHKSPVNVAQIIRGALSETPPIGYNITFRYPETGLNDLAQKMAQRNRVYYGKRVVHIDVEKKVVHFHDGFSLPYEIIISTLPLDRVLKLAHLHTDLPTADPATSVLVLNIGAIKGPRCPQVHWVYIPHSKSGFHRVGFYSNVDPSFLPASSRQSGDRVGIYVEKSYPGGYQPDKKEIHRLQKDVVCELQAWEWIEDVEVISPTWIDVAYTWTWPNSRWREQALTLLEQYGIFQVGRYARWAGTSHGIMDSIRDGLMAGAALRNTIR